MIDTSIVATSIYDIGVEFKDVRRVNWVALAYTLAYLGCAVTFARISDVVGRKAAFVAAYIIFFAFSLGCGFAQTLDQLIACRTFQGIGGSGKSCVSLCLRLWSGLADTVPRSLLSLHDHLAGSLSEPSEAIHGQCNRSSYCCVGGPRTCSGRHLDALHHLEMGLLDKVWFPSLSVA